MAISETILFQIRTALVAELDTDPQGLGYKTGPTVLGDGYRPTIDKDPDNPGLMGLLNTRPVIANPVPAPQIDSPITLDELIGPIDADGLIPVAELAVIIKEQGWPLIESMKDDIAAKDKSALISKLLTLKKAGYFADATVTALITRLSQKIADPDHPATILGPTRFMEMTVENGWVKTNDIDGEIPVNACQAQWIDAALGRVVTP